MVGRLGELPSPQQRLEEARRLEDLELHLLDLVAAHTTNIPPSPSTRAQGSR